MTIPKLKKGEIYAGISYDAKHQPFEHVILLPLRCERGPWGQFIEWCKSKGVAPVTRQQAALVWANLGIRKTGLFELEAYWTNEEVPPTSASAFLQSFDDGGIDWCYKDNYFRGFAVRSVPIKKI